MIISTNKAISVDDETITDTVQVLYKNGINVNRSLIPNKSGNFQMLKIENVLNKDIITENIFSKKYSLLNKEDSVIYSSGEEQLITSGSYFEYTRPVDTNIINSEENVKEYLNYFFQSIGIDCRYLNISSIRKVDNGYIALYKYVYKDKEIFDADIKAMFSDNIYIQGYAIKPIKFSKESYPIIHITSKLITFMKSNENIPITITGIDLGYLTQEESLKKDFIDMVIMPAWKITTDNSNIFYYDAMTQ
jgi:hypothetical protein